MKRTVLLFVSCLVFALFPVVYRAVADAPEIGDPIVTKTELGWDISVKYEGSTPQKLIHSSAVETNMGMRYRSGEALFKKESFKDGRITLSYPQKGSTVRRIEWTIKFLDAEGRESNPVKVVLE